MFEPETHSFFLPVSSTMYKDIAQRGKQQRIIPFGKFWELLAISKHMRLDGVKAARATRESYHSKRGRLSQMHTDFVLVEKTAPTPRAQPDKRKSHHNNREAWPQKWTRAAFGSSS